MPSAAVTVFWGGCLPGGGGCLPGGHLPGRCLPRGVCATGCLPGGVCPGGCLPQCMPGYTPRPLWTEFFKHASENITFPQLRLRTVIRTNKNSPLQLMTSSVKAHHPSLHTKTSLNPAITRDIKRFSASGLR